MEYYEFKEVEPDKANNGNEPSAFDFIHIKGNHNDLLVSYYDVVRLIKALRQGKREIEKFYRHKARKEQSQNDR